jgi:DNA-directed RNA polymerase subunit N (RpoN/RPB10)
MNFKGQVVAKYNVRCHFCGRPVGPSYPQKIKYIQYGAGGGEYCNNTCARRAYEAVVEKNPELRTVEEPIFKEVK